MKSILPPQSLRALVLAALAGSTPALSLAQTTFSWSGATSGAWSTATNWSPSAGSPPGTSATDIARFDATVTNASVALASAVTIGKLEFLTGAGAYAFSGSELTISGTTGTFISSASAATQTFSNTVKLVATGNSTIDVGSGSTIVFSGGFTGPGSTRNVTISGGGTVSFTGAFTAYTTIQQLRVGAGSTLNYDTTNNNGASSYWADGGRLNLYRATGSSGISLNLTSDGSEIYLSKADLTGGAATLNFRGDVGNKTLTFGADFSGTGTSTYSGSVNLNSTSASANNTYRLYAASGNTLALSGTINDSNASASGTKVEIAGAGVVRFSGSSANTSLTPIVIASGATLELAKTAGVNAIAGGSVTLNTGGALRLAASNQIADATALAFAGGTFNAAAFTESLGALTVGSAGGVIDFGGSAGSLTFAGLSSITGTLTITGWTENASIVFTSGAGWDSAALSRVVFAGYGAAQFDALTGELYASAIPEPASAVAIAATLALGIVCVRRRRIR